MVRLIGHEQISHEPAQLYPTAVQEAGIKQVAASTIPKPPASRGGAKYRLEEDGQKSTRNLHPEKRRAGGVGPAKVSRSKRPAFSFT